jgi:hypothetical protein
MFSIVRNWSLAETLIVAHGMGLQDQSSEGETDDECFSEGNGPVGETLDRFPV